MYFGILADAITGIREIPLRILQSTLPTLKGIRGEYLKGITEERTIILDAQKLLSDKNIIVNEEVVD
jgi:purine-binding chemotaxis protein CheW